MPRAISATESGATASIRFPQFLGIPNRLFKGQNIPRTDISASFNYQNRPEYKRTMISTSYGYSGNLGKRFFFQFYPAQLNIVRIFNMDANFEEIIIGNPYLSKAYNDHFDLGLGGTL